MATSGPPPLLSFSVNFLSLLLLIKECNPMNPTIPLFHHQWPTLPLHIQHSKSWMGSIMGRRPKNARHEEASSCHNDRQNTDESIRTYVIDEKLTSKKSHISTFVRRYDLHLSVMSSVAGHCRDSSASHVLNVDIITKGRAKCLTCKSRNTVKVVYLTGDTDRRVFIKLLKELKGSSFQKV